MIRVLAGWVAAVVLASVLGSVIQTQYNLAALADLDVSLGLAARLQATFHDLWHFAPLYGALVAVSFFVAWPVAGWLARRRPTIRPAWFALAGAAAVAVMLVTMNTVLPITPVAATRDVSALVLMSLAGGGAGLAYARLVTPRAQSGSTS